MPKFTILIPDSLHIRRKTFPSFFKFINKERAKFKIIKLKIIDEHRDWIELYGNYDSKFTVLETKIASLSSLSEKQLFNLSVRGVNLFKVARAEILSRTVTGPNWYDQPMPRSAEEIFQKLWLNDKVVLLQCLAAAWQWIEFWAKLLHNNKPFTHAFIFSGSLIYQRSLMELLKNLATKVFLMEYFFTGNECYCEEKYEPIANNSDIKFKTIYDNKLSYLDAKGNESIKAKELTKALNKMLLVKKKNMMREETEEDIVFIRKGKIITILGQVVNDFSVLEYNSLGLSTIYFYKKLINKLIDNGYNVVFKAHPWEETKKSIRMPFTKTEMLAFYGDLPKEKKEKLKIVNHYPINKLFKLSDYVVGLNSQGLIEAALEGFKPVQFGNAFYGQKGFTHDYQLDKINLFIEQLNSGAASGTMNLFEYSHFQNFLIKMLQGQLFSRWDPSTFESSSLFSRSDHVKLLKE